MLPGRGSLCKSGFGVRPPAAFKSRQPILQCPLQTIELEDRVNLFRIVRLFTYYDADKDSVSVLRPPDSRLGREAEKGVQVGPECGRIFVTSMEIRFSYLYISAPPLSASRAGAIIPERGRCFSDGKVFSRWEEASRRSIGRCGAAGPAGEGIHRLSSKFPFCSSDRGLLCKF